MPVVLARRFARRSLNVAICWSRFAIFDRLPQDSHLLVDGLQLGFLLGGQLQQLLHDAAGGTVGQKFQTLEHRGGEDILRSHFRWQEGDHWKKRLFPTELTDGVQSIGVKRSAPVRLGFIPENLKLPTQVIGNGTAEPVIDSATNLLRRQLPCIGRPGCHVQPSGVPGPSIDRS